MIIYECEQGSAEWFNARAGAITASMFSTIRDRLKTGPNKGGYKKAAEDYAFRLAVERISGEALMDDQFTPFAARRGNEMEPEARARHALDIGMDIKRAGFVATDDGKFGASADGLIGDDGGSEYKCLVAPERLRTILVDQDLSEFADQVQGCLWLTGRTWWHFCLYCPALRSISADLIIHEVRRDDDYIEALERDLVAFDGLVGEYVEKIKDAPTHFGLKEAA